MRTSRGVGRRWAVALAGASALTALAACGSGDAGQDRSRAATTSGPASTAAAPAGLVATTLDVPADLAAAPFDQPRQVLIPSGWTMSVWARVPAARLEAWTPDGDLLVSQPGAGAVVRLAPTTSGAPTSSTLLAGLDQPHGLAFDGSTLYVAESDAVDAYTYAGGAATGRRTLVVGLPDAKSAELGGQYAHALKSVAVGADHAVYFSVGSTGNISAEDRSADPERAAIYRVPPGGGAPEVYARGVRNGTGLAVAPDGAVWTAVNNRDNIEYPFDQAYGDVAAARGQVIADYVADHPAEELAKLTAGRDLGWPYCNPDPDVTPGAVDTAYDYTTPPFVRDVETNADGSKLDCAALPRIEQTFGAHSAPLGLSFATLPAPFGAGALVGVHGSWNRQPPRAPEVSFFPAASGSLGTQQTLVGGFQAVDGSRWGRPVAAVTGPDGAVYVSDDAAGAIYRLAPPA